MFLNRDEHGSGESWPASGAGPNNDNLSVGAGKLHIVSVWAGIIMAIVQPHDIIVADSSNLEREVSGDAPEPYCALVLFAKLTWRPASRLRAPSARLPGDRHARRPLGRGHDNGRARHWRVAQPKSPTVA